MPPDPFAPRPPMFEPPDLPPQDEHDLVLRLRAGDASAFEQLVRIAGARMLAVARRMLPNEDDAQDAVQEAFLNAFRSLDRFDERARLTTWLHRITVNACLMKLRTRRRKPECQMNDLLPEFLADGHQKNPARPWNPARLADIEQQELRDLLRAKIDELPDPFREVFILRDVHELSTEETADLLGLTPPAVKSRLHRARQALRTLLDPHFADHHSDSSPTQGDR